MDEQELEALLDDLHGILGPVANTGASREQLHAAVKRALEVIDDAYGELEEDEDEDDEGELELELDDEEEEEPEQEHVEP